MAHQGYRGSFQGHNNEHVVRVSSRTLRAIPRIGALLLAVAAAVMSFPLWH